MTEQLQTDETKQQVDEENYVSRNKSAKELRLMCSPFIATSVKII